MALEALREGSTLAELSAKDGVTQGMISRWKSEMLQNAAAAFGAKSDDERHQKEVERLHRKIGELEMDVDFLKRASKKLGSTINTNHRNLEKIPRFR